MSMQMNQDESASGCASKRESLKTQQCIEHTLPLNSAYKKFQQTLHQKAETKKSPTSLGFNHHVIRI